MDSARAPTGGAANNQTINDTIISFLPLPLRRQCRAEQNLNSYYACYGTTIQTCIVDHRLAAAGPSTGLFTQWAVYGIRDCTDGTSNTVAFSEALTGNGQGSAYGGSMTNTNPSKYRGNFIMSPPSGGVATGLSDAFQNVPRSAGSPVLRLGIPAGGCRHRSPTTAATAGPTTRRLDDVQHDSAAQRHLQRLPLRLQRLLRPKLRQLLRRQQRPPGRSQRPDGRRQRAVHQELDHPVNLVVARHESQR